MTINEIVTILNNLMEDKFSDIFCKEFECSKEDLIPDWGFGYSGDNKTLYIAGQDEIYKSTHSLKEVQQMIENNLGDSYKELNMIEKLLNDIED